MHTPPFLLWTLAYDCPLRDEAAATDPAAAERQLRSLAAYSEAMQAGRCWEGICLERWYASDEPAREWRGFPIAEVLSAYGGEDFVAAACGHCPANLRRQQPQGYAGCFGLAPLDDPLPWQRMFAALDGEWPALDQVQNLLARSSVTPDLALLRTALDVAQSASLPLHVRLYPAGRVEGEHWIVAAHCPRCKGGMSDRARRCAVCDYFGHAEPERRRKKRGNRPFLPLARFMGAEKAAAFMARVQRESVGNTP